VQTHVYSLAAAMPATQLSLPLDSRIVQLANEPRAITKGKAYRSWISEACAFIRGLDKHHLVSLGSEGMTPWSEYVGNDLVADHAHIDYVTVHVWPQNWNWYNPGDTAQDAALEEAWARSLTYVMASVDAIAALDKPLVVEEFGLARDEGSYAAGTSTKNRDVFFRKMCSLVAGLPGIAGLNFWAWGGEGRPSQPKASWHTGDMWIGDPPHEWQGWYSIYNDDLTTMAVMRECAEQIV